MKTRLDTAANLLALNGVILMGLGLYFIFVRPPLLPEDPRFMGTSLEQIQATMPGLLVWLRRVFWVMGGFMFASGLLLLYVAQTTFRTHLTVARLVIVIATISSIGWMSVVNFMIDSDFKWLIFAFNLPWITALILSMGERRNT